MKDIKFRFRLKEKETKDEIVVYADLYNPKYSNDIMQYPIDLDRFDVLSIEQYTGIKDINEKEIYEGDIVRDKFLSDDKDYIYKVVFEDGVFATYWLGEYDNLLCDVKNDAELIGNIYDSPELLN